MYEQVLHRLASYCARGERCIFDLRWKMTLWELTENEQLDIIQHLQSENFFDEKRFCRAYIHDKSEYNHWGINKIKYELSRKHIPEPLIREVVSERDTTADLERLRQLLETKRQSVKGADEYEINQKLKYFALRKGFPIEDIEAVLEF
jgi:regulatory protein